MKKFYKPNLDDFLPMIASFKKNEEEIQLNFFLYKIKNEWQNIVGEGYFWDTEPLFYRDKTLIILVNHSTYSLELNANKSLILKNIEQVLGGKYIEKLSFKDGFVKKNRNLKLYPKKQTLEGKEKLIKIIEKEEDEKVREKLLELVKLMK